MKHKNFHLASELMLVSVWQNKILASNIDSTWARSVNVEKCVNLFEPSHRKMVLICMYGNAYSLFLEHNNGITS